MVKKIIKTLFLTTAILFAGYAGDVMAASARQTFTVTRDFSKASDSMLQALTQLAPISLDKTNLLVGVGAMMAVILFLIYRWQEKQIVRRDGEEQGSAAWAKPKDMTPYTDKDVHKCIRMTNTEALSLDTHKTRRNLNVLVIGASGAGKTRGYVMPNLRNLAEAANTDVSFAVTDPKGELHLGTQDYMAAHGYKVKVLNLVDMKQTTRFNPLKYIRKDSEQENLMSLCDNIIQNMGSKDTKQDFWFQTAQALLRALVSFVYYYNEHPTLLDAFDLLSKMQASEQDEDELSDVDALFQSAKTEVQQMLKDPQSYSPEAQHALRGLQFAASQYRAYEQAAGETKKSIITTLANMTASANATDVRNLLSDDEMDLHNVGQERTIIYICISDTNTTFNWIAAIFYQSLFETTVYDADHTPGGALPVPLHCFLDEFANVGKIPGFPILISTIRSRGISVSVIIQTLAQLKGMYKDDWETLAANCDSKLFLGGNDQTTTKWISDMLGKQTITVRGVSTNKGASGGYTLSNSRQGRELMSADELGRLDNNMCVYLLRGLRPFLSHKVGM